MILFNAVCIGLTKIKYRKFTKNKVEIAAGTKVLLLLKPFFDNDLEDILPLGLRT